MRVIVVSYAGPKRNKDDALSLAPVGDPMLFFAVQRYCRIRQPHALTDDRVVIGAFGASALPTGRAIVSARRGPQVVPFMMQRYNFLGIYANLQV